MVARRRPVEAMLTVEQEQALAGSTIVSRLARRWSAKCRILPLEDLEGVGWLEATSCAARFDPSLGIPFDGFARDFVHFAMQRAISRERRALDERRGRIVEGGIDALQAVAGDFQDPGDPWADGEEDLKRHAVETAEIAAVTTLLGAATVARAQEGELGPAERQCWTVAMAALDAVMVSLPDDLRRIVEGHHLARQTMAAIADELAMSEPTVRRRHREAMTLLAKRLRARGVSESPAPFSAIGT